MSESDCIFCKIVAGDIPCFKVFENEVSMAFLDAHPLSEGHTLLIPKEHYPRVELCPDTLLAEMASHLGILSQAAVTAVGAKSCNILLNNGREAGQVVDHVHFHVVPRKKGDQAVSTGQSQEVDRNQMLVIAKRISEIM